jgi:hypothetical protein
VIRNKTFFFVRLRVHAGAVPSAVRLRVPTELQRRATSPNLQRGGPVDADLQSVHTFVNASGNIERRPFCGQRDSASMLDPVADEGPFVFARCRTSRALPSPIPTTGSTRRESHRNHQMNFKGDHNFNSNNRISGRYSQTRSTGQNPNLFGEGNPATFTGGSSRNVMNSMVADYTHVRNATTLFTFRYGYTTPTSDAIRSSSRLI